MTQQAAAKQLRIPASLDALGSALGKPVLVLREESSALNSLHWVALFWSVAMERGSINDETRKFLTDDAHYRSMVIGFSPYGDGRSRERLVTEIAVLAKRALRC